MSWQAQAWRCLGYCAGHQNIIAVASLTGISAIIVAGELLLPMRLFFGPMKKGSAADHGKTFF